MRTLALLASLLLLALHGHARHLGDRAHPVKEPEDQLPALAQAGAKDQDMVVFFERPFVPAAAGSSPRLNCYCRLPSCNDGEIVYGFCTSDHQLYFLCCS